MHRSPAFTLFFIHIPKTAGSTMQDILGRQYDRRRSFTVAAHEDRVRASLEDFRNMDPDEREKLAVVKGHCVLAVDDLIQGPKRYAAFLREPFQHFKSGYYYIRRAHWNPHSERVQGINDLHEYLEYRVANGLDNTQTRHLSGVLDAMIPLEQGSAVTMPVDQALYNKAHGRLMALDHMGLTHLFDASLLMMKDGLDWRRHCSYQVQNRTEGRPDPMLDPRLEERFREVYRWDLALYEAAKSRFDQSVEGMGPGFMDRVYRFQQLNRLAQWGYRLKGLVKPSAG
jgi:hypothetical protein